MNQILLNKTLHLQLKMRLSFNFTIFEKQDKRK